MPPLTPSIAAPVRRTVARLPQQSAEDFIQSHTKVFSPIDLTGATHLPECPICFEDFTSETLHEVTGVQGCSHIFGIKCLAALLSVRPGSEKRCPLCRTVWIPASTRRRPSFGVGMIPMASRTTASTIGSIIIESDSDSSEQGSADDTLPPGTSSTNTVTTRGRREMFPGAAGVGDEEVTEESFQEFRRQIESIRARAPRNQHGVRVASINDGDVGTRGPSRRSRIMGSNRRTFPVLQRTQTGAEGPGNNAESGNNGRRFSGRSTFANAMSNFFPPPGFVAHRRSELSSRPSLIHLSDSDDDDVAASRVPHPSSTTTRHAADPATPSAGELIREADLRQRELSLNQKERGLDQRELNLSHRDIALDQREISLREREALLTREARNGEQRLNEREEILRRREQEIRDKEERINRILEVVERQFNEREELRNRQREELRNLAA